MINGLFVILGLLIFPFIQTTENASATQRQSLPIEIEVRKSFFGGSYVLQIKNISDNSLTLWIEAKEKRNSYSILPYDSKDIGWVQGYRFDANDAFILWGDGFDTVRQMMPSEELSDWRLQFAEGRGLILDLSQSYVQKQLQIGVKLPLEIAKSNLVQVSITDYPQVVFQEGSNRLFADIPVRASWKGTSTKVIIKTKISFIPIYEPSSGKILASDLVINDIDIKYIPREWFTELKNVTNILLTSLMQPVSVFQLEKTLLNYASILKARDMVIRDGRLHIYIL